MDRHNPLYPNMSMGIKRVGGGSAPNPARCSSCTRLYSGHVAPRSNHPARANQAADRDNTNSDSRYSFRRTDLGSVIVFGGEEHHTKYQFVPSEQGWGQGG